MSVKRELAELGFSTRAVKCLARRDIKFLDELLELSKKDLMRIRHLGKHTFDEINEKIKAFGLHGWE